MTALKRGICLLTDFGGDYGVGRLKGSIRKIAPSVDILDLDHKVPPQKPLAGAWRLLVSIPSLPKETVIVAIVDPHVGSRRKGIAVELETGHILIGPADNGLLSAAVQAYGIKKAHFLENPEFFNGAEVIFRPEQELTGNFFSSVKFDIGKIEGDLNYETFHGLKIFGPAGAHITQGVSLEQLGPIATSGDIAKLILPLSISGNKISGCLTDIEAFGTLRTDIPFGLLERIGVKRNDWIKIEISFAGIRFPVFGRSMRVDQVFEDGRDGDYIAIPGSCGGALDIPLVNGSAAHAADMELEDGGDSSLIRLTCIHDLLKLTRQKEALHPMNTLTIERTG